MEGVAKTILYLLMLQVLNTSRALLLGPVNTAAGLGQTVSLTCDNQDQDAFLQWSETTTGEQRVLWTQTSGLNTSHPWNGSYVVDSEDTLIIPSVVASQAGMYSCELLPPRTLKKFAVVIVVDTPQCKRNDLSYPGNQAIEGVIDNLGCSVQFFGAWGPNLQWTENDVLLDGAVSDLSGYVKNIYQFVPTAEQNGTTFVCLIYFLAPDEEIPKDEDYDQRTPTFRTTCEVPVEVLYTARIVNMTSINPNKGVRIGDELKCEVKGNPIPDVIWINQRDAGPILVDGPVLTVFDSMVGDNTYTCSTNNSFRGRVGLDSRNISFLAAAVVHPEKESSDDMVGLIVGCVFAGLSLVTAISTALYVIIKRQNVSSCSSAKPMSPWDPSIRRSSQDFLDNLPSHLFPSPSNTLQARKSNNYIPSPHGHSSVINHAYNADEQSLPLREPIPAWEVDRRCVVMEKVLGEGHFGIVHKARVHGLSWDQKQKGIVVAVKTLKANASDKDKADLFNELEVMRTLPEHENVVKLLGCCTINDPIFILVEFVSNGNLKDFLRLQRSSHMHNDEAAATAEGPDAKELMGFALQVSRGMDHISQHQLLHRDLAARNILISKQKICKVSDFGLSRDIIDRNEYNRESSGALPLRWMAPESIFDNISTAKSDVWSYGVLLWEIVTLGASPYPGMSPKQVITQVKNGYRMETPEHCVDEIGDVMQRCWQLEPSERPDFKDIMQELDSLLLAESDYLALELYQADNFAELEPSEEEKV